MQPLPLVYAYQDCGFKAEYTRWKPRRVLCTATPDHSDRSEARHYIVKPRQGPQGAAALVSEVVCHALFEMLGVPVLQAAIVEVSPEMAVGYQRDDPGGFPSEGLHFGTVEVASSLAGPPPSLDVVRDPEDLIRVYVADAWVENIDRDTYGNLLMVDPEGGRFRLIAADQSDCFGGSDTLQSGRYLMGHAQREPAYPCDLLPEVVLDHGCSVLDSTIGAVEQAADRVGEATDRVPAGWWTESRVDPGELRGYLRDRANRIRRIIPVDYWMRMSDATRGGQQLELQ